MQDDPLHLPYPMPLHHGSRFRNPMVPAGGDLLRFFKARSEAAIPAVVLPERGTQKNRQSTPALRIAAISENKGKGDAFEVFENYA